MTTAPSTRLHRSKTTGEWVPCHATVRACPRDHIEISASGTMIEKADMLADVVSTVKNRNKKLPVDEQLAAVRKARLELSGKTKPYKDASGELWEEEKRLVTKKWKAAEPRDYLELDDYDGMQSLMDDAFSDSAASEYQRRYMNALDPFLKVNGYQPNWMLPAIRIDAPYGLDDEQIEHLAAAVSKWASFVTRHRKDESNTNGSHSNYLDAYGKMRVAEEEKEAPYENIQVFDDSPSDKGGMPSIRVYGDGTATPVMTTYGTTRVVGEDGSVSYVKQTLYEARKPIAEVLRSVNKVWYYPAESKPGYKEPKYSWEDDYDNEDL